MALSGIGIPKNTFIGAVTTTQLTMIDSSGAPIVATVSGVNINFTVSLPILLARNLNSRSINTASLKTWFQNATLLGGAVTWGDASTNKY